MSTQDERAERRIDILDDMFLEDDALLDEEKLSPTFVRPQQTPVLAPALAPLDRLLIPESEPLTAAITQSEVAIDVVEAPSGLKAEYFNTGFVFGLNSVDFSATPYAVARVDTLDIEERFDGFWAGAPADGFAARYSGTFDVTSGGTYTFFLNSDDGAALYIDGKKVIDNDGVQVFGAIEQTVDVTLFSGVHDIEIRYFDFWGSATLDLEWQGPDSPERSQMIFGEQLVRTELSAEYYSIPFWTFNLDDVDFGGKPDAIDKVNTVQYDGDGALWATGPLDLFAARYKGDLVVETAGAYTFFLTSDDGSRLFIDGDMVIDNDSFLTVTEETVTLNLERGLHDLELQYFDWFGEEMLQFDWQGPDSPVRSPVFFGDRDEAPLQPEVGDVLSAFGLPEDAINVPIAIPRVDGDGDALAVDKVFQPINGVVSMTNSGDLVYNPDDNFSGLDAFRYEARDENGELTTGFVELDVERSHRQPHNQFDEDIAPELSPSGEALLLRRVAEMPELAGGEDVRMNFVVSRDDAVYVVGSGNVDGTARIFKLTPNGSGEYDTELWFDVSNAVFSASGLSVDTENFSIFQGGARSIAFHPEFDVNGKFYISLMQERPENASDPKYNYLSDVANPIEADNLVVEWTFDHAAGEVDLGSYREVFRVGMPVFDHPIKQVAFNKFAAPGEADYGMLYVSHGDGSFQSATAGGGQNSDALGKILRIDPLQNGAEPYSVPADNPFVDDPSMLDEVYAIGFRNPHNFSFAKDDDGAVHLIATGIGRDNFDEVNIVEAGGNYGWSDREGPMLHINAGGGLFDGVAPLPADDADFDYIYPAAFMGHDGPNGAGFVGQALAGGFVIDTGGELDGDIVIGDFGLQGRLFNLGLDDLLAADTKVEAGESVEDALTWATPEELLVLFDHDSDASTTPIVYSGFSDLMGAPRSDFRFGEGMNGELLIVNKQDGYVYSADNTLPVDNEYFQSTDIFDDIII